MMPNMTETSRVLRFAQRLVGDKSQKNVVTCVGSLGSPLR